MTSLQIDRVTVEAVTDFIFLGSKITVDNDYSQEIKRCLLLGRKEITNLDSIIHLVKAIVFPVVMYGCEIWDYKES